jgi:hypothetical protein
VRKLQNEKIETNFENRKRKVQYNLLITRIPKQELTNFVNFRDEMFLRTEFGKKVFERVRPPREDPVENLQWHFEQFLKIS